MSEVHLEARHVLVGDSFWLYSAIAKYQSEGHDVIVRCRSDNAGVFEFIRDYAVDADKLAINLSPGGATAFDAGGPSETYFPNGSMRLRREPEPIATKPYICFQPESAAHAKRSRALKGLVVQPGAKAYSIGVLGEYVVSGSEAFHSKSISEVARLIYHSQGMVAIMSSMALLAVMLGKKLVCTGYDGLDLPPNVEPTGHEKPRCIFSVGGTDSLIPDIVRHIGPGFLAGT